MKLISFVNLLNMSVKGSFVIAAVLLIRLIFRNRSAKERMPLWVIAGLRLIIPVSLFESSWSVVPRQTLYLGETAVSAAIESAERAESAGGGSDTGAVVFSVALGLWVLGVCLMAAYFAVSTRRLKKRLRESVEICPGVFACDRIGTPFIFGLWSPRLYVPSFLGGEDLEYVIAHEKAHIRRRDNWWKPLAFAVLTLHWFNPLVWAAYFAFGRDLELACDESSTCWRNFDERKAYANALINCSAEGYVGVCPVAFGGGDVKRRVSAVLHNAAPKVFSTVLTCAVVLVGFAAEPDELMYDHSGLRGEIWAAVIDRFSDTESDSTPGKKRVPFVNMEELGLEKDGDRLTVYLWVLYERYYYDDGDVVCGFSRREAVRVTATDLGNGEYEIAEYLVPAEEQYGEVFPLPVRSKVLHFDTLAKAQSDANYVEAATTLIPLYEQDLDASGGY